ncbi:uncharacterized protein PHACADRAFT_248375 [Phanerochaete carnosa HHB-10118-sp]|uniref:Uncharacterized protein n=1 Tax=Phanerochaete carnosa (strain HHB-10118-sp) TaxID=650164 RepID=K5WCF4_PHACS|nr:uncharacterized protein PHACADRAFT_248375 [Phanerochaete carnosa HHB-10118-sp]EKM61648.1 hypothetical protein PHACADRAFT_248375 [Phanerochaete carnosa HHB-10118-sp]
MRWAHGAARSWPGTSCDIAATEPLTPTSFAAVILPPPSPVSTPAAHPPAAHAGLPSVDATSCTASFGI